MTDSLTLPETGQVRRSTANVGIFRTADGSHRLTSVNRAFESICGVRPGELQGRDLFDRIHDEDRDEVRALWQDAVSGRTDFSCECRLATTDGADRRVRLSASPLELDDSGYVGSLETLDDLEIGDELEGARLATAIEQIAEAIVVTGAAGNIRYVNPAFEEIYGYSKAEAIGQNPAILKSGLHDEAFYSEMWSTILSGKTWSGAITNRHRDGGLIEAQTTISPMRDHSGRIANFVAVTRDMTEQRMLERQLGQAQKLESIGQLAAGIAHEINTPTQYVGDNTRFLQEAFQDLVAPLKEVGQLLESGESPSLDPNQLAEVRKAIEEADLDYLADEIPRAVEQTLEGVERVTRIVRAMKEFSHPAEEKTMVDLNRTIDSTITVARNEWKYVAELEKDFDEHLEPVACVPGDINQTILNMIVNAAHAIGDVVGDGGEGKGTIRVSTRLVEDHAEIRVSDTGTGIPEQTLKKVFEPFFTTKEVGKGTGQGLSIAHSLIVKKHGGELDVESEVGKGTTFIIRLPMVDPGEPAGADT